MSHIFYMGTGPYVPSKYVGVLKYELDGITYYFIDNQEYFDCFLPYGDIRYDIEKFTFFDKAVLSMLPQIGFQPDLIHCHDWQAGLIPVFFENRVPGRYVLLGHENNHDDPQPEISRYLGCEDYDGTHRIPEGIVYTG